jgi:DNA repair exonuclease SbcCD ATPase subunit
MSVVTENVSDDPTSRATVSPPASARRQFEKLATQRQTLQSQRGRKSARLDELNEFLALLPAIDDAMEKLSAELFSKLAELLQGHLTSILQDVLQQPIKVVATQDHKRGAATLRLHIERDGQEEDIMRGSGGSVANVLSVGLRLLALAQLDPAVHRRFLVLDEQDCWLAPELVPRLVKIVSEAGDAMGFQVVMISHHAPSAFEQFGKRIYRLVPGTSGVCVETVGGPAKNADIGADGL